MTLWDLNTTQEIGELLGGSSYQQFGYALSVGKVKAAGTEIEVNCYKLTGCYITQPTPDPE